MAPILSSAPANVRSPSLPLWICCIAEIFYLSDMLPWFVFVDICRKSCSIWGMLGQRARSVLFENFISDLIRCHHATAKTCSLSNQGECPPCPRPAQLSAPTLSSNTRSTSPWCQSYCCPQYSWVYRVPFKSREEWDLYLFILLFLSSVECT